MTSPQQTPTAPAGPPGGACESCGSVLQPDQRYCLNCGARRGELRMPYEQYLAPPPAREAAPVAVASERPSDVSPLGAILGIALLGGMLLIGVLIGRGDDEPATTQAPAAAEQSAAPSAPPAESPPAAPGEDAPAPSAPDLPATGASDPVVDEWPTGTDGFTVELGTLPREGTDASAVEAAKESLEARGAEEVGVLDSDDYPSLPPGNYVLYSGVFDSEGAATKALGKISEDIPEAGVIEVSRSDSPASAPGASGAVGPSTSSGENEVRE